MIMGQEHIAASLDAWANGQRSGMFNAEAKGATEAPRRVAGPANDRQSAATLLTAKR